MTILDWVLVAIWAGITLGGFFKGAVRIVFGLGGTALGIWLAVVVGPDLSLSLADRIDNGVLAIVLAYFIPFAVVSLMCLLAGWGMEKALEGLKLGCLNRLLGAVLAGAATAVVLAVLLVSAVRLSPELAAFEERSVLLAKVQRLFGGALPEIEMAAEEPRQTESPADTESDDLPDEDSNGR